MRALVLREHGALENLEVVENHPTPTVKPGHVVIKVGASSFNYHDVFTVKGMPGIKVPLPVVIGLDMAGEITEVGDNVTGWKVGDRVLVNPLNKTHGLMGEMLDGGMAEYCLVAAEQLIKSPTKESICSGVICSIELMSKYCSRDASTLFFSCCSSSTKTFVISKPSHLMRCNRRSKSGNESPLTLS